MVRLLLDRGAEVNKANNNGDTLLHAASHKGHDAMARLLLDRGAEVNKANNYGDMPLHAASGKGHDAMARLLLDRGAEVNKANNAGTTPLHYACHFNREAVARLLVRRGADDPRAPDEAENASPDGIANPKLAKWIRRVRGFTPLHWACEDRDFTELLRLLRSNKYERGLPPLAELEAVATRATKRNPACSRTLALLRSAYEPWDVLQRYVWPRSFRERMWLVHCRAGRKMQGITFLILSYCQWWWCFR